MPSNNLTATLAPSPSAPSSSSTARTRGLSTAVPRAHQPVWEILATLFLALIAHHTVIYGSFHQDDEAIINAARLKSEAWDEARKAGGIEWSAIRERPLYYLSLVFNFRNAPLDLEGRSNPFGFHVFNLLGHLLAVAGLYLLVASLQMRTHVRLRRLGLRPDLLAPGWGAVGSYLPLFAAALFAVHPLASEPVAYVMARANGWGGAFFLWFLALGVKALTPPHETLGVRSGLGRRVALGLLALLCLVFSWGFKETHVLMAILLPLALWLSNPPVARVRERTRRGPPLGALGTGLGVLGGSLIALGVLGLQWELSSTLAAVLGLLAAGLPPLLLLYRHAARDAELRGDAARALRSGLLAGGFCLFLGLLAVAGMKWSWSLVQRVRDEFPMDPEIALTSQAPILLWNWARAVFPWRISLEYDHPFRNLRDPVFYAALAGHAALLLGCWYAGRRRPLLRIAVLLAYLTLLPTNSVLLRYDLWSDRNGYLACAGACVALVGLAQELALRLGGLNRYARPHLGPRGLLAAAFLLLWLGASAWVSHDRDRLYADPEAFWGDTVANAPKHPRAHLQLAFILDSKGKTEQARVHYEEAVKLCDADDYFGHSHWSLWRSLAETRLAEFDIERGGEYLEDAEERLIFAIRDNPNDPEPLRKLVRLYLLKKDPASAEDELNEAEGNEEGTPLNKEETAQLRQEIAQIRQQLKLQAAGD